MTTREQAVKRPKLRVARQPKIENGKATKQVEILIEFAEDNQGPEWGTWVGKYVATVRNEGLAQMLVDLWNADLEELVQAKINYTQLESELLTLRAENKDIELKLREAVKEHGKLSQELLALRKRVEEERSEAIEECAKVCESQESDCDADVLCHRQDAAAIRSLAQEKGNEPQTS